MCEPLNARSLLTPAKCLPRVQQRGAGQPATAGPAQRHLPAEKTMTSSESRAAEGRLAPSDAGLLAAEDSGSTSPLRRLARPPAHLHELCAPRGGVRLVPHGANRRPVQACRQPPQLRLHAVARPSEGTRGATGPSGAWSRPWARPLPPGSTPSWRNGSAPERAAAPAPTCTSTVSCSVLTCDTCDGDERV